MDIPPSAKHGLQQSAGARQQGIPSEKHLKHVLHAFDIVSQLQSREVPEPELLSALKIIVFLMAPESSLSTRLEDLLHSLIVAVRWSAQLHGPVEKAESTSNGTDGLKWSLKVRYKSNSEIAAC